MEKHDLIIIGGGAGAFAAAIKADELGANTLLINDGLPLGGTCVNVGCVPSKALLHAAEIVNTAKNHSVPGITFSKLDVDFTAVIQDELALVTSLREKKYEQVLKALPNVTFLKGRATFASGRKVRVGEEEFEAERFIIATGSTAIVPEIDGLVEAGFITHVEAMSLKSVPKRLLVIGAGAVGLELAQMYSRFGSQVTIVQRGPRILPSAEEELTERLQDVLESEGIEIVLNAEVTRVARGVEEKKVFYSTAEGDESVSVDEILVAAGKRPNTSGLNLGVTEVIVDHKGRVATTATLQTSQPSIFAVGDVTNLPLRLETTAGREGTYAAENALTGTVKFVDYNTVPSTVFTDPQLASIGYTEDRQMAEFNACACRTVAFENVPKALITKRSEGMIKMAIHPESQVVMGVHILAPDAGDLIAQAAVIMKNKNTVDDVIETLPVFPTMSEAIKIVAMSFKQDIAQLSCCI